MRFVSLVAVLVVLWAAFISIQHSIVLSSTSGLIASVALTLGTTVQRISGVQRWLNTPKTRRERLVEGYAQQALSDICRGREITDTLLELRIHIWVVPIWYRKLFPFQVRERWKELVLKDRFPRISRLTLRPTLRRMAAVGLQKPIPSGVRFKKGQGVIGVCIANNDSSEILSVNISSNDYKEALAVSNEAEWRDKGVDITHNLSLAHAKRLAKQYGQVIARVVQDASSGEAIGCVTIGLQATNDPELQIVTNVEIRRRLKICAQTVADSLV